MTNRNTPGLRYLNEATCLHAPGEDCVRYAAALSGPGPNTVLADGTPAYVPGEVNRACGNRYAPVANANGYCGDCGQSIALHDMVPLAEWAEVERRVMEDWKRREQAAAAVRALGTPIRWYHRLWWRVRRWVS